MNSEVYHNKLIDQDILTFTQINEHFVEYLHDLDLAIEVENRDDIQSIVIYACLAETNPTEEITAYIDGERLPFQEGHFSVPKALIAGKDSVLVKLRSESKIAGTIVQTERVYSVEDIESGY